MFEMFEYMIISCDRLFQLSFPYMHLKPFEPHLEGLSKTYLSFESILHLHCFVHNSNSLFYHTTYFILSNLLGYKIDMNIIAFTFCQHLMHMSTNQIFVHHQAQICFLTFNCQIYPYFRGL